jgi:hypothetical protein
MDLAYDRSKQCLGMTALISPILGSATLEFLGSYGETHGAVEELDFVEVDVVDRILGDCFDLVAVAAMR